MENSLLAGTGMTGGGSGTDGGGDGFEDGKDPNAPSAKDFDFSQEGGTWEEAKRYDSSLFDD